MRKRTVGLAAAAVGVAAAFGVLSDAPIASATYSTNCWAYTGGTVSSGGCKGAYPDGTYFSVYEYCYGFPLGGVTRYSALTYAPPGKAVSAQTAGCGWGHGSAKTSGIAENW